jgi:hypothetical protein
MAHKATHQQTNSSSPAAPVVLFGVDNNGKPKAARFIEKHAELATKAADHLKLQVLHVTGPAIADLAGRLPAGRIHANGRGFVPYIRRDLYAKLVAAAGTPAQAGQPSSQPAASSGSAKAGSQQNGDGSLPKNWGEIGAGHVVIALDEPGEGWYEAVVVETSGDMLTVRWRDYPRERRFSVHRLSVGLLYPHGLPATDPNSHSPGSKPAKPKHSASQPSANAGTVFAKTWDDIDCLVLAKERRAVAELVGGDSDRQERSDVAAALARLSPSAEHHTASVDTWPSVPERALIPVD